MKKYLIPKLIGLAVLTMAILIILSILEVAIYSYIIHPGQESAFYDAHAEKTAPYISAIFGFLVFFLTVRYWHKKAYDHVLKLALLFPLIYILLDIVIISLAGVAWSDFIVVFLLANGAKVLGSLLGYQSVKTSN